MEENKTGLVPETNTPETNTHAAKEMRITEADKANLKIAARWANFIAIVGFVMLGLGTVVILIALLAFAVAGVTMPGATSGAVSVATCVFYLVYIVVSFPMALYLYRFAENALTAIENGNEEKMSESLLNLGKTFKYQGILTIALLVFMVLIFFVAIFAGMVEAAMSGL